MPRTSLVRFPSNAAQIWPAWPLYGLGDGLGFGTLGWTSDAQSCPRETQSPPAVVPGLPPPPGRMPAPLYGPAETRESEARRTLGQARHRRWSRCPKRLPAAPWVGGVWHRTSTPMSSDLTSWGSPSSTKIGASRRPTRPSSLAHSSAWYRSDGPASVSGRGLAARHLAAPGGSTPCPGGEAGTA